MLVSIVAMSEGCLRMLLLFAVCMAVLCVLLCCVVLVLRLVALRCVMPCCVALCISVVRCVVYAYFSIVVCFFV